MTHTDSYGRYDSLVQRLEDYGKLWGLVVGPWGEGSKDLHTLISVIGKSMVDARGRETWNISVKACFVKLPLYQRSLIIWTLYS